MKRNMTVIIVMVNILLKASIFPEIGKKNNQSSVSVADRKTRFRHYPFTLGLGFLGLHRRPMIDSIYSFNFDDTNWVQLSQRKRTKL